MLSHKFGITKEIYDKMFADQGGVCKICGGPPGKRSLAVDHCHKTGKVRGLLCSNCNVGIGNLQDDLNLLEKAAQYIRDYE